MFKPLTAALAALAVTGGALFAIPSATAQPGPGDLAPPCLGELDVDFNPNPCGVPPTPTPGTPVNPDGPGDLTVCEIDPLTGINPCPHDDPDTPVNPDGPGDLTVCEINPLTGINPCHVHDHDHDDDGETPDDDGETPDDDGETPDDDGETPDDDGPENTDDIDPADPADPIDGDPNFTG